MRLTLTPSLLLVALASASSCVLAASGPARLAARQANPSPTGRGACVLQAGNWVCELAATGAAAAPASSVAAAPTSIASAAASPASSVAAAASVAPSPVGQVCHQHGDHWHCEGEGEEGHDHSHEGHSHSEEEEEEEHGHSHAGHSHGHSHEGHSHAGHSHGPSEEYGCGLAPLRDYSVPLHVGALFVLLIASALGCAIPHAANVIYKMRGRNAGAVASSSGGLATVGKELRFILKHFGSGILLSTAFIHLLFHSFVWFSNSCVGELKYEAASAAIAMAAVYVCFLLDFIALRSVRQRVMQARQTLLARSGPQGGTGTGSEDDEKLGHREEALSRDDASEQLDREEFRLNKWSIVSLEAGIVFHSIIIGVTLGASSGEGWVPLLIAITFHQFCEALGLASRIAFVLERAHAEVSHRMLKIVLHSVFILSTSFGIAIGIGVRKSFNGNDRDTLLTIGVLDSVSAGILLYSSLTQILPKDWLESREMLTCGWGRIAAGLGSFTAGLFIMSLLGYWA